MWLLLVGSSLPWETERKLNFQTLKQQEQWAIVRPETAGEAYYAQWQVNGIVLRLCLLDGLRG